MGHDPDATSLAERLARLEALVEAQAAELAVLRAGAGEGDPPGPVPSPAAVSDETGAIGRRRLLLGGAAATGAAAAAVVGSAAPAAAVDGSLLVLGSTGNTATSTTGLATPAVPGFIVQASGTGPAIFATAGASSTTSVGIHGNSSPGTGVLGVTVSGAGVKGEATTGIAARGVATSGTGVKGEATGGTGSWGVSGTGTGVKGTSTSGVGVDGVSTSGDAVVGTSGNGRGVLGLSTNGRGVTGGSTNSAGVKGEGATFGVEGVAPDGVGVAGRSNGGVGVAGSSTTGVGVTGEAGAAAAVKGTSTSGPGAHGLSIQGPGLLGESASGVGVVAVAGRAQLLLTTDSVAAPISGTVAHEQGEVVADADGVFWVCVESGNPGSWRILSSPATAGSLHLLATPARVYDSRPNTPPSQGPKTPLPAGNVARTIDLKANSSSVPAGARGALVTVLLVNAATGSGNFTIWANDRPKPLANTLVWGGSAGRFTTLAVTSLDAQARVKVDSSLQTNVVLDVVGYYR